MKNSNISKAALKDMLFGAVGELVKNSKYYYKSMVGSEYSHLTDEGKEELAKFFNIYAHILLSSEQDDLDKRAKEMVIKGLKGDQT